MQDDGSRLVSRIPQATRLFSPRRIDHDLVAEFFMTLARTEYAVRSAGYLVNADGLPVTDWDRFALALGDALFGASDPVVKEAIAYLVANPPQKQVVTGGQLRWKPRATTNPNDPVFLIRSVTTVRNNLFHGGKEIDGLLAERDRRLLTSGLVVLGYAVNNHRRVLERFGELPPEHDAA